MSEVIPHEPSSPQPLNLAHAFDLARPLAERSEYLMQILSLAAELTVQRDEESNPDAYADPEFREQQVRRRTLKGIEDLRQASNMMELRWAMQNGHETWVDSDGAEVDLLEVIEGQMPAEEQRKSSGRARQVWAFAAGENSAVAAFREQGIPDQVIATCGTSGMSSVLGIVSEARKKLAEVTPPEELRATYQELIEAAADTTTLDALKRKVRTMVNPTDKPPPPILYSVEHNGEWCWVVARPTREQWLDLMYSRLKDVLEADNQLPEWFVRYWQQVPQGQG